LTSKTAHGGARETRGRFKKYAATGTEWLRRAPRLAKPSNKRASRAQAILRRSARAHHPQCAKNGAHRIFFGGAIAKTLGRGAGDFENLIAIARSFENLDMMITPGTRGRCLAQMAVANPRLFVSAGEEEPDTGEVKRSDKLSVAYFEQNRDTLDPEVSLSDTLCPAAITWTFAEAGYTSAVILIAFYSLNNKWICL